MDVARLLYGNAPHEGGAVELQLRRVEGGRFSTWAFEKMKMGDVVTARGPLGTFRIRSPLTTPLLFVARGTGFAPIKAMIEQQLRLNPAREMLLFWGVTDTGDFYDLEELTAWAASDSHFRATLTARHDSLGFRAPVGLRFHKGTVYEALVESELDIRLRDAYVAGPSKTVAAVVEVLLKKGVPLEHVLVDSYGI